MNSLTINLHLMLAKAFFRPQGRRTKILVGVGSFLLRPPCRGLEFGATRARSEYAPDRASFSSPGEDLIDEDAIERTLAVNGRGDRPGPLARCAVSHRTGLRSPSASRDPAQRAARRSASTWRTPSAMYPWILGRVGSRLCRVVQPSISERRTRRDRRLFHSLASTFPFAAGARAFQVGGDSEASQTRFEMRADDSRHARRLR